MNDIATVEDRIASKLDTKVAGQLVVSDKSGGLAFTNAGEVMEFAKMLSISQGAVPKHLRGNPGACLGIVMQAIEWRMSPFAVANKSYVINDRLAFEAQLIHAVAIQRAPIRGRIKFEFTGEGATRKCRAWASVDDGTDPIGEIVEYTSPAVGEIKVKNSPLWVSDPDQQLTYYSVRALCRRHFPDVLMGIFAPDEFDTNGGRARDVTPRHWQTPDEVNKTLTEKLDAIVDSNRNNRNPLKYKEPTAEINVPDVRAPSVHLYTGPVGGGPTEEHASAMIEAETAKFETLLAAAKEKAKDGEDKLISWFYDLSTEDYNRLERHIVPLREAAAKADARKK